MTLLLIKSNLEKSNLQKSKNILTARAQCKEYDHYRRLSLSFSTNIYIYRPLDKSLRTMSSRSLALAASNVMNVPRPLVEFINAGYSASKSLNPDMSTSPDFSTTDNSLSFLITFKMASSNRILVGSPIQVLNTRYGKSGLYIHNGNRKFVYYEHNLLLLCMY